VEWPALQLYVPLLLDLSSTDGRTPSDVSGSCSERVLGLGLLVEMLMQMAEWNVNRFWDRTTWIRVIPEQNKNKIGPKEEHELVRKKLSDMSVLTEPHHSKGRLV
jgi:hypothetical protein